MLGWAKQLMAAVMSLHMRQVLLVTHILTEF